MAIGRPISKMLKRSIVKAAQVAMGNAGQKMVKRLSKRVQGKII